MPHDVFISYERTDAVRVGRLAEALSRAGFGVWWDRGQADEERASAAARAALDDARCVIAVWSKTSTAEDRGSVLDQARQAWARGVLLAVSLDNVRPPSGFDDLPTVDLSRWDGSQDNPRFAELTAATRARVGSPAFRWVHGRLARLRARILTFGFVTGAAAAAWGFYVSDELQAKVCALPLVQPALSDACGALGLGDRASRAERLQWRVATARPGDCDALSAFVARYPQGAYAREARNLLESRYVATERPWVAGQSTIDIYQPRQGQALASESIARQAAIASAGVLAERECQKQAAALQARFVDAVATAEDWNCDRIEGGTVCGFQGHATCRIDTPVELCGAAQ